MLAIIALSYNDLPPVVPVRGTISGESGTIGRDAANNLVLPDPARLVSRMHVRLVKTGSGYQTINISDGNPFFVNDQEVRSGASCVLSDGDILQIGGYVLRVRYSDSRDGGVALPNPGKPEEAQPVDADRRTGLPANAEVASVPPTSNTVGVSNIEARLLSGPFDDLLGGTVTSPHDDFTDPLGGKPLSNELPPPVHQGIPQDFNPFDVPVSRSSGITDDPLDLQGIALSSVTPRISPFSVVDQDPDMPLSLTPDLLTGNNVGAVVDGSSFLDPLQLFRDDSSESSLLAGLGQSAPISAKPVHVADELEASFRMPAAVFPGPIDRADQVTAVNRHDSASIEIERNLDSLLDTPLATENDIAIVAVGPTTIEKMALSGQKTRPEPAGASIATAAVMAPKATAKAAPESSSATLGELRQALEDGLQATLPLTTAEITPETMRLIGMLLRVSISGTLDLMRARSVVKKEIRAQMTVIEPADNNPLKFSPDADVAVQYLFGKKYPGFLGPIDAMSSAYADLAAHQLGMVAGMRSAMEGVVSRFDPAKIKRDLHGKRSMSNLIPLSERAAYWSEYCRRYQTIADTLGEDFQNLYANVFTRAYEEEVAGHSTPRGLL